MDILMLWAFIISPMFLFYLFGFKPLASCILGLILILTLVLTDFYRANNNGGKLIPPKDERKWCHEGNKVNCGWIGHVGLMCW